MRMLKFYSSFKIDVPSLIRKPWILTKWIRSREGIYKLNSNGCCKGNPGDGGGGSILITNSGQVVFVHTDYYGVTTNTIVEAKALMQGLQLCTDKCTNRVDIEVDYMLLLRVIEDQMLSHSRLYMRSNAFESFNEWTFSLVMFIYRVIE